MGTMNCPKCNAVIAVGSVECPLCKSILTQSPNPVTSSTTNVGLRKVIEVFQNFFLQSFPKVLHFFQNDPKRFAVVGVLLVVLLIFVGYRLSIKKPDQVNYGSSIPPSQLTKSRVSVDAYGSKPVAGEDYQKGVIVFGLKYGDLQLGQGEVPIDKINNFPYQVAEILKRYEVQSISQPFSQTQVFQLQKVYVAKVSENKDILNLMTELQKDSSVSFAEPNYFVRQHYVPSDPYFSSKGSWGQGYDDLWGLKLIDMPKAWDLSKGAGVKVAVIDTGVDNLNPDLEGNVTEGYGGISLKFGFTGDCNDTHGTHIAGIIGAKENGFGMVGVAPAVQIVPFSPAPCEKLPPDKLYEYKSEPSGQTSPLTKPILDSLLATAGTIIYAPLIAKAAGKGILIANFSSGLPVGQSSVINSVIDYAVLVKGMVFVASAGNESKDVSGSSPANNPRAIVVSAVEQGDNFASYSNYGRTVAVAAPGGDISFNILSTGSTQTDLSKRTFRGANVAVRDKHIRLSGTSMAAPHVAGLAALVKSLHPDWSNKKIKCAIILGAEDKGPQGWDPQYGYGRINAYKTLSLEKDYVTEVCVPYADIDQPVTNSGINISDGLITITGTAVSKGIDYYSLEYLQEGSDPASGWGEITKVFAQSVQDDVLGTWDVKDLAEGNYQLRLVVYDKDGKKSTDEVSSYLYKEHAKRVFDIQVESDHIKFVGQEGSIAELDIVGTIEALESEAKVSKFEYAIVTDCSVPRLTTTEGNQDYIKQVGRVISEACAPQFTTLFDYVQNENPANFQINFNGENSKKSVGVVYVIFRGTDTQGNTEIGLLVSR